jgi:hypothetical protein
MKTLTFLFLLSASALCAQDLTVSWGGGFGSSDGDTGNDIAVDGNGNVYLTGSFRGTTDMDPGPGVYNLTSAGTNDIFVSKFDSSGTLLWAKAMGGQYVDAATSIAVDPAGNTYITGGFCGTADFDPGPGTFTLTAATTGQNDIFIAKLDPDGNFVWAKGIVGGTWWDAGYGIACDPAGSVVITGRFYHQGGPRDFDPGPDTFFLTAGGEDVFVLKLDLAGNFVWAVDFGTAPDENRGYSVDLDAAGNIYTTGYYRGTVDFDPDSAATFNLTSVGTWNVFFHKMDPDANLFWAFSLPITTTTYHNDGQYGRKIAVDPEGNLYATGRFSGTIDFDPGAGNWPLTATGDHDIYLAKYDSSGALIWARSAGGDGYDEGFGIAVQGGTLYACGTFQGTADLDPGADILPFTSNGDADMFLLEMDTTGTLLRASAMGGTGFDRAHSVCPSGTGAIFLTGWFTGTTDLDPGTGTYSVSSNGGNDGFLAKLIEFDDTGINELARTGGSLGIYPNPANELVNIACGSGLFGERAVIDLFDATGKRVQGEQVNALGALQPFSLSGDLKEGLYLLMVRVEGQAPKSARVVVRR